SALLDDLDRVLARLEQSPQPASEISTMFRLYHTLKGASNSVGLAPIGQQLHIIESFVERIAAAPALPDLRQLVSALAGEHTAMRTNIARASAHTALEVDHARTNAQLAAIAQRPAPAASSPSAASGSWIAASDPVWEAKSEGDALAHASGLSHASH